MGRVNIVRPDGSILAVDEADAAKLEALGYSRESDEAGRARGAAEGKEAYFSQTGEKAKTVAEGVLSGATLGISDHIQDWVAPDNLAGERADYNPGYRLGGEIVGAVGTSLLTGGSSLAAKAAAYTPAGLVTRAGTGLAAKAGSAAAKGATIGVVEGAGAGLQAELANSALNDDPLTVESVVAGVGWGAFWGGASGGFLGKAAGALESKVAAKEAVEAARTAELRLAGEAAEGYTALSGSLRDTGYSMKRIVDSAGAQVKGAAEFSAKAGDDLTGAARFDLDGLVASAGEARVYLNSIVADGAIALPGVKGAHGEAAKSLSALWRAIKSKDFAEIPALIEAHTAKMEALEQRFASKTVLHKPDANGFIQQVVETNPTSRPAPRLASLVENTAVEPLTELDAMAKLRLKTATDSYSELARLGTAGSVLRTIPHDLEGFAKMTPQRAEAIFGSVDTLLASKSPELQGTRQAIAGSINEMAEKLGLVVDGGTVETLRAVYTTSKALRSKAGEVAAVKTASEGPGWLKRMATQAAGTQASAAAASYGATRAVRAAAYSAGRSMFMGLLGLKGAVVGTLAKRAAEWTPQAAKAARVAQKAAPKIEPLLTRLDGTQDRADLDRKILMKLRAQEIRDAAPGMRDALYKAISPLAIEHPAFAAAAHKTTVEQFKFIFNKLPRDPGTARNRLASTWQPDPVETERFARYYEAFQNPVAVASRALATMDITPEAAETLRETQPALFTLLRVSVLERLADPEVLNSMDYDDQIRVGNLLDIKVHGTMDARFIAPQQQMFMLRNQPLTIPPQPGMGNSNGGRGNTGSSMATQAQRTSQR